MKPRPSSAFFLVLLFSGLLASCAQPYHQPEERYIFVAFNTGLPYWQEAEAGLNDAAKQMGVKAELTGPANFSPNEELTAFQQAVALKPSGILVSASNPDLFKSPINEAILQGIPVICVDADAPNSNRVLFVGTDNFRAGQESGKRLADILVGQGKVVIITIPGQYNLDERVRGVNEALRNIRGSKSSRQSMTKAIRATPTTVFPRFCKAKRSRTALSAWRLQEVPAPRTRFIGRTWTAKYPSWRSTKIPKRWIGFSAARLPRRSFKSLT